MNCLGRDPYQQMFEFFILLISIVKYYWYFLREVLTDSPNFYSLLSFTVLWATGNNEKRLRVSDPIPQQPLKLASCPYRITLVEVRHQVRRKPP